MGTSTAVFIKFLSGTSHIYIFIVHHALHIMRSHKVKSSQKCKVVYQAFSEYCFYVTFSRHFIPFIRKMMDICYTLLCLKAVKPLVNLVCFEVLK